MNSSNILFERMGLIEHLLHHLLKLDNIENICTMMVRIKHY